MTPDFDIKGAEPTVWIVTAVGGGVVAVFNDELHALRYWKDHIFDVCAVEDQVKLDDDCGVKKWAVQ